jgi:tetratricopeptide (TPR) repeat protein
VQRDDRFDLYYRLGTALNELDRYDQAFTALRRAINQDPRAEKDETLWAKYHVARLYERRGQLKTARQMYQTLLRGRYIEALHRQVERRLTDLPASR